MKVESILGFTVIAAFITTAGSLLALFLKELLFSNIFESWKDQKNLERIYNKYKKPIILSACELCRRLNEIIRKYPPVYLKDSIIKLNPKFQSNNTINDIYFQKYKFVSTIYRFCAFWGWLEIYRQDITFLDSGSDRINVKINLSLRNIKSSISDGQLNQNHNWESWIDYLIFREELRAIGELMIIDAYDNNRSIMGYGKFSELFESFIETGKPFIFASIVSFFVNLQDEYDFRKERIIKLIVYIIDLIELLDKSFLKENNKELENIRKKYSIHI